MTQLTQIPRLASGVALYKEGAEWGTVVGGVAKKLRGLWVASASPAYAVGDVVETYYADGRKFSAVALGAPGSTAPTDGAAGVAATGTRVWAVHTGVIYPATDMSGMPTYETIIEQGYRGQGSRDLNARQGGASGEASFDAWVYPDILGNLFRPMFGQVKSVAAATSVGGLATVATVTAGNAATTALARGTIVKTVASSNTRYYRAVVDIKVTANLPVTDKQFEPITRPSIHTFKRSDIPASATIFNALGSAANTALIFKGARCGELGITFNSNSGVLETSTTWMTQEPLVDTFPALFSSPGATGADDPGPSYVGWQGVVSDDVPVANASIEGRLIAAEITIARDLGVVHTARNNRSPYAINVDPIGISGTLTIVAQNFQAQYDEWRLFPERNVSITFSSNQSVAPGATPGPNDPFPERTFKLQMSRTNTATGPFEIDRSDIGVTFKLPFTALHNLTDEGPGQVIVQNATAAF